MEWLETLSGGFVALIIASLLLISLGFFSDSIRRNLGEDEAKPLSRSWIVAIAVGWLVLTGYWVHNLLDVLSHTESDWFTLVVSALWVPLGVLNTFMYARAAIRGETAVDIR